MPTSRNLIHAISGDNVNEPRLTGWGEMILKAHERNALLFDVFVRRLAQQAPFPPLTKLAEVWKKAAETKQPGRIYEDGSVHCFIGDVRIDDAAQMVTVLIRRVDKRAPNAAYADTETRALRIVPKTEHEGAEHACHIVISLDAQQGQPHTYAALLEQVPGIPFVRVQAILMMRSVVTVRNFQVTSILPIRPGRRTNPRGT